LHSYLDTIILVVFLIKTGYVMLKNKSLVLLLALLAHTTTYNRIGTKQAQQSLSSPQASISIPLTPISTTATDTSINTQRRLSEYNFGAGSVLPFIITKGKKYLILSREAFGKAKDTYDDFGGKRDPGENHPVITAAREFLEEASLQPILGFSLENTQLFIDIAKSNNTEYIIASSRNVAYITDFTAYADKLFANFYAIRETMTEHHLKEKDRLALVEWDALKATIAATQANKGVMIKAQVLNPQNLAWQEEEITLRDFFVIKYRPFFTGQSYKQGMNKKIRFYDTAFIAKKRSVQPAKESWSTRFWNWVKPCSVGCN
jgi:8-oxo-dGTP pyrophosphatase MutT (NUDIX family)